MAIGVSGLLEERLPGAFRHRAAIALVSGIVLVIIAMLVQGLKHLRHQPPEPAWRSDT